MPSKHTSFTKQIALTELRIRRISVSSTMRPRPVFSQPAPSRSMASRPRGASGLHARRKLLLPVLGGDSRPLKLQLLLDVLLLALLIEDWISVAVRRRYKPQIMDYSFYNIVNPSYITLKCSVNVSSKNKVKTKSQHSLDCQAFLQGCILLPAFEHHQETRVLAADVEGWRRRGG